MASLLALSDGDTILEPAAGDGHLINAVQRVGHSCRITAYELHRDQVSNLNKKFASDPQVTIIQQDTIFCPDLDLKENFGQKFSKIIANPPYGGWQEYERRAALKKRFRGFYVRETYTLFLLRCLRLLAQNGKLVFIIPNTFLYLNRHNPLRKYILEEFSIDTIDIFKSSLFPGVSFGYADLCIISISAKKAVGNHSFRLRFINSLDDLESFYHIKNNSHFIVQKDIINKSDLIIPVTSEQMTQNHLFNHEFLMADIADCVTGFYSGNDKRFLRRASIAVQRSKRYKVVDHSLIEDKPACIDNILDGICGEKTYIPILKGGGYHFLKPKTWFMDWSKAAVNHYKSDQKARFQNSSYYFKKGIGFPMVTSTRPTASLIDQSLFDQSVVGIFPKEISLEFLLAYCNSKPFWACLKTINPSANNSAKYVLRTPVIRPEPDKEAFIAQRTQELLNLLQTGEGGAEKLQNEILESITQYVKKKESHKMLKPTSLYAIAQL